MSSLLHRNRGLIRSTRTAVHRRIRYAFLRLVGFPLLRTQATHVKQRFVDHGVLCADDKKEWHVPSSGILRVDFVEEPDADRTLGEVCNKVRHMLPHAFREAMG